MLVSLRVNRLWGDVREARYSWVVDYRGALHVKPCGRRYGNQMLAKGKGRRVSPTRERYEQRNPTVTIRLNRELYDELKALKEESGQTPADVLKIGLDRAKSALDTAFEQGIKLALEGCLEFACDSCQDEVLALAFGAEIELS